MALAGTQGGREPGSQWDTVAAQLIRNAGESGVILDGASRSEATTLMGKVNGGHLWCFRPAGEFLACTRGNAKDGYAVYAKHVGGDE